MPSFCWSRGNGDLVGIHHCLIVDIKSGIRHNMQQSLAQNHRMDYENFLAISSAHDETALLLPSHKRWPAEILHDAFLVFADPRYHQYWKRSG
jgi:hypothetical protein